MIGNNYSFFLNHLGWGTIVKMHKSVTFSSLLMLFITLISSSIVVGYYFDNKHNLIFAQAVAVQPNTNILVNANACDQNNQNPISPISVTIPVGSTISWRNNDTSYHQFKSLSSIFDTGPIAPGRTSNKVTFKNPETLNYFDNDCNNLHGTIDVAEQPLQVNATNPQPVNATNPQPVNATNPQPVNATNPQPVNATNPQPVNATNPQPVNATNPQPVNATNPQPVNATNPQPVNATSPQPVNATSPQPVNATNPQPVNATNPQPVNATSPQPVNATSPQSLSSKSTQHQVPAGFLTKGTINSLIFAPHTKWIATGNWSMNVNNGSLTSFETNMTWFNQNGTASHTHEFRNFKNAAGNVITIQQPSNNVILKGVMDVGTNHRIVWKNVPTTIHINGDKTITISVDKKATNNHFAGQPIVGVVKSFMTSPQPVNATSPQSLSSKSTQHQVPAGFLTKGTINSLIFAPHTKWIATGNWSMNVNNGSLTSFETNMTWFNQNGTASHTHEFRNFKNAAGNVITIQQPSNNVILKGVMDVGTNHRIVWKNVPTTIHINGDKTITISVDKKATNNHFAGQPIVGVVKSFMTSPQPVNATSPQSLSSKSTQHQVPAGFLTKGTINSLIFAPHTKWITTGNWSMNVNNGSLTSFETNMTWFNQNGTASHTHEFRNFKNAAGNVITIQQPSNNVILKGVMDVGTNHRIVWKNVPTTIHINGDKTIIISVDTKATNNHFAGQPIVGVVKSFTLCSDIPGPNMEILPICSSVG